MSDQTSTQPNLFIVGGPKCASSSMHYYLEQHPDIFMSYPKELFYLMPDLHHKPMFTREEYLELFTKGAGCKYRGESTPLYIYSQKAPEMIKGMCDDPRIIILVRNPVDMLYSLYWQNVRNRTEPAESIETALNADEEKLKKGGGSDMRGTQYFTTYKDMVSMSRHIQRYIDFFGREKIHLINFDDLKSNGTEVCQDTYRFLGVDPAFAPDLKIQNPNTGIRFQWFENFITHPPVWLVLAVQKVMPKVSTRRKIYDNLKIWNHKKEERPGLEPEIRERLKIELKPEIDALSDLFGRDLSGWYAPEGT